MIWKVITAAGLLAACGLAAALAPVPAGNQPWITLKGRVLLPKEKTVVAPLVNVGVDKDHCLSKGPLFDEAVIVDAKTRGLKNVWVYLRPDDDDVKAVIPKEKIHPNLLKPKPVEHTVDTPCCQFIPRILAVRAGDKVRYKNSAPIPHTVNLNSVNGWNEAFNVVIPPDQNHVTAALVADRSPLYFSCNIHPWMKGMIMVFDHPYFAVTDAEGKFEIKNAPAGKWRIMYRHENGYHKGKAGNKGFPVEIKDHGRGTLELLPVEFEFPEKN